MQRSHQIHTPQVMHEQLLAKANQRGRIFYACVLLDIGAQRQSLTTTACVRSIARHRKAFLGGGLREGDPFFKQGPLSHSPSTPPFNISLERILLI